MAEKVKILISEDEIRRRVKEIAAQINRDYQGQSVHLICIMKGSLFYTCELARNLTMPVTIDYMAVSSYGSDTKSSGVVKMIKDLDESIEGKNVIVVEDIIDSGRTLSYLLENLSLRKPARLALTALLDKPDRRVTEGTVDYTGFVVPDYFVVGYGLDYDQRYRNLPYVGVLSFTEEE